MASEAPLILDDVTAGSWESFHAAGRAPVGGDLLACWARSQTLGAPAEGAPPEERLLRGDALRMHAEHVEVLRALGDPVLERATARAAASQHVLLLADADGVIVHVAGGGQFAERARRLRLIEGACWSEAARGTNAIGTAAEVNRVTTVRGHAHFGRPYQGLVCYAAPVRGIDGRPLAILDATSMVEATDHSLAAAVAEAAHTLEEIVRMRAYASAGASVRRILLGSLERLGGPALLVETPGRVARANTAARALFGGDPVGEPAAGWLGLGYRELVEEARNPGPSGRIVAVGRQGCRLRCEPIDTAEGLIVAVLVELEPLRRAFVAPAPGPEPSRAVDAFASVFAEDATMVGAIRWARQLADSEIPIMLLAETGAGKDLFAQAIHDASGRAAGPFVAVNCGAVAPGLLESELFGYAPGAFTGADRAGRPGLFQAADGGTLFLDEVAEMSMAMQAALLRVLETGVYRRVGAVRSERSSARVVCATCRDLPALVTRGEFRQDLYYRLKGAMLRLPALRARTDLIPLARHLLAERSGIDLAPSTEQALAAWPWPGNVRELKATLEVALLVAGKGAETIFPEHLPAEITGDLARTGAEPATAHLLARSEAEVARRVLGDSDWNISDAARKLGIARSTLYRMVRRYALGPSSALKPRPR